MNMKSWRFKSIVGVSTIGFSAAIALGVTGVGSDVFAAGTSGSPSVVTPSQSNGANVQPFAPGAKKLTLLGTYVESGEGGSLAASTLTAIDSVNKLTCPAGQTCTITDTISVEMAAATTDASDQFASAWQLDGSYTGEEGPYIGELPTDQKYVGGTWTDRESGVSAGKHTVQSFAYAEDGASLGNWTVTYCIYD
jgi:hypothetical protein